MTIEDSNDDIIIIYLYVIIKHTVFISRFLKILLILKDKFSHN